MMRWKSLPEMPVRRVEISKIARNHILKGFLVFSSSVPEVRLIQEVSHDERQPQQLVA